MPTNETRRELLNRARVAGYPGSITEVFQASDQGIDLIEQHQLQQQQQQEMQVAETSQQQEIGLREQHAMGNTQASMAFPDVQPNQSFNTVGMEAPIDIQKIDDQGHLVESYKNVPPGIQDLPTGPSEGTIIESPAAYQKGGVRKYHEGGMDESRGYGPEHMQEEHHTGGDTEGDTGDGTGVGEWNPSTGQYNQPEADVMFKWSNTEGFGVDWGGMTGGLKKAATWGKGIWDKSSTLGKVGLGLTAAAPVAALAPAIASDWSGFKSAIGFQKGGVYHAGGLYHNINHKKKSGTSRSKSDSTISAKNYTNMKSGFKKQKGGFTREKPRPMIESTLFQYPTKREKLNTAIDRVVELEKKSDRPKVRKMLQVTNFMENSMGNNPKAYNRSYTNSQASIDPIMFTDLFSPKIDDKGKSQGFTTTQKNYFKNLEKLGLPSDSTNFKKELQANNPLAATYAMRMVYGKSPESIPEVGDTAKAFKYYNKNYRKNNKITDLTESKKRFYEGYKTKFKKGGYKAKFCW